MPPGRLLIFFFQTDQFVEARLHGLMRMALQARQMLDTLLPTDRVAVLAFDSHLKLRQDFTADHAKLERAIRKAILTGPPPDPDPEAFPRSLARSTSSQPRKQSPPRRRSRSSPRPPSQSSAPSRWSFSA